MSAAGRLHLIATLALLVLLGGVSLAPAGVYQTPAGGWGMDRSAPPAGPPPGRDLGGR